MGLAVLCIRNENTNNKYIQELRTDALTGLVTRREWNEDACKLGA